MAIQRVGVVGFGQMGSGIAQICAQAGLDTLVRAWHQIEPVATVREAARRFLRVHDLRSGDALQLGAAFVAAEGRSSSLEFVCLDDRLCAAAQREGFAVVGRSEL